MSEVPFRPLGSRVVIRADREDHAPQETETGLLLAKTLAAAVEGQDAEDSWFVGTIVAIGPLVRAFDIRAWVRSHLRESLERGVSLRAMWQEFDRLPATCPDPLKVGDRVTFSWASGQQITVDGDKFLIMPASDVLAVLEPEEELYA